MRFLLTLMILVVLGPGAGALGQEAAPPKAVPVEESAEAPKEGGKAKRGLFSKLFKKEPKKEEPKPEEPRPEGAKPEEAMPTEPKKGAMTEAKPAIVPEPTTEAKEAMSDKEKARQQREMDRAKEKEEDLAREKEMALAREKKAREKILAKEREAALAKEKEMALAREREMAAKEKDRIAMEREMEAAAKAAEMAQAKEQERIAKEKEAAIAMEQARIAKEKEMALAKEKEMALAAEQVRVAKEKEMALAAEQERIAKEKEKEMALAKEKQKAMEAASDKPATAPPPAPQGDGKSAEVASRDAVLDQIRGAIRKAARQVEVVRERRGEAPGDLVKRVEAILAKPERPKSTLTMRETELLKTLRRPSESFVFLSKIHTGGRGFSFDDTEDGRELLLQELRRVKAEGGREIERLLQLGRLVERQGRSETSAAMAERAVLAARTHLARRPENAEAHALLAAALSAQGEDSRKEMHQEIETALRLEKDQPLALLVRLEDHAERLREHLLKEGPRRPDLPAREREEVLRRLYAQPPSDAALAAHEAAGSELRSLAARVMDRASGDAEILLRATAALTAPVLDAEIAELARTGKVRSFEEFLVQALRLEAAGGKGQLAKMDWKPQFSRVLEAAGDDGPMIATVSATPVLWGAWKVQYSTPPGEVWASLPEQHREMFEKGMDRAVKIGLKDESISAAKACEAVACLEFTAAALGAKVRHEGLALRAITLDPWRIRALDLLASHFATGFPAAAQALMEIRVAVLDGYSSHHMAASAANKAEDWAAAERHLEACLSLQPDDLAMMNELIAIRLCGAQTAERLQEVETRFTKARAVYSDQLDVMRPDVAEAFVANYVVFLCLKEDWKSATEVMAVAASNGQLTLPTVKELAMLIRSQTE